MQYVWGWQHGWMAYIPRDKAEICMFCGLYFIGDYCGCHVGQRLKTVRERYLRCDPKLDERLLENKRLEFVRYLIATSRISDGPAAGEERAAA